ncbi:SDR family oxidoreductase [Bacillus sp. ISL-35]|uniref:SDR family oxidoreductase n=1 Tax=Bacillus sp. ISL-35 TaxID=2819122 RepID=UPI001BEC7B63|nr:SDR family oxidoreductase [Bacillus sp. ISL-35]MBT2680935.1 SDR family oxidoreductase [Bacillus sp. ISL-35]MBT2705252.1 SDR family oxidoreductase [Chryseobacterium sp. ISL-80]
MKHAIITGSSSGFGKLIAIELAKSGYQVIATMRNLNKKDGLMELAAAEKVTDQIHLFPLDVTINESIEEFKKFLQSLDSVDLLVNNAGYAQGGFSEELEVDAYRKQFETNFFGVIAVTQAVLPIMRQQRYGKIINMSSISGRFGFPGLSAYAASKHALEGYSESLRLELKPFGINVVLIEPGSYKTDIWKSIEEVSIRNQSPYESSLEAIMYELKNAEASYGNPHDVARLVAGIASANSPQLRYPIGKGIKNTLLIKNLLPWKTIEKFVMKKLNI